MLWSAYDLRSHVLEADGEDVGSVEDLLFEDTTSTIRYVVVDTGTWLPGRKVLIAPEALERPRSTDNRIPTRLSREQVEKGPPLEADLSVSRRYEEELHRHYGWQPYWAAPAAPGIVWAPAPLTPAAHEDRREEPVGRVFDPTLRSAAEVTGYYVAASDDDIGHVEDLLVEDEGWQVRWIVVDTRNWLPGKTVVIPVSWVAWVSWSEQQVGVAVTRAQVEGAPEYRPSQALDDAYQQSLATHYGRPLP
jgi:uncharacterized protein YrrD